MTGFVLSLDLELNWGNLQQNGDLNRARIMGARDVVPHLLALFDEFETACTWAVTGPLFFENKRDLLAAWPSERPTYESPGLSSFDHAQNIGADEQSDPLHFGLSLVRQIRESARQEVATHTFSHYFCLDTRDNLSSFDADLEATLQRACDLDLSIRSIVFPRNQIYEKALRLCADRGLTAFRGTASGWGYQTHSSANNGSVRRAYRLLDSYVPLSRGSATPKIEHGLVDVAASYFLRSYAPRRSLLEPFRLHRILGMMRRAARDKTIFHLWFHPHNFGLNQSANLNVLRCILEEARVLREAHGWGSWTMDEIAQEVFGHGTTLLGSAAE